jgi:hypothetical protein
MNIMETHFYLYSTLRFIRKYGTKMPPPLTAPYSDVQTEATHHNHLILILK